MRKAVVGGLAAAALTGIVGGDGATAAAQVRDRAIPPFAEALMLQGRGSQIGVSVRDLNADEIAKARLPQAGGVLVQDVREESPAARAGLRVGDILIEFDGERVRSASHFTRLVRETPPGRAVKGTVLRSGARTVLDITPEAGGDLRSLITPEVERQLRALPRDFDLPSDLDPTPDLRRGPSPRGRIGVTLAPLTDQLATYFGVKGGALVSAVDSGSAAAQAGILAGDVIVSVNGAAVRDSRDVTRAVREARPGAALDVRLFRDKKEMTVKVVIPELVTQPRSVLPV
jgi:serine protease Do